MADGNGNGQDRGPMAGWAVVQTQGVTLLGRVAGDKLSPVYELRASLQQVQQGIAVVHLATPPWLLLSIKSLPIPAGAIVTACEELDQDDRRTLHEAASRAGEMVKQGMAQRSGIMLAPANTKLPPVWGP